MIQGDKLSLYEIDYKSRYNGDTLVIDELIQGQLKCSTLVSNRLDEEILKNLSDEHLDRLLHQLYEESIYRKLNLSRTR